MIIAGRLLPIVALCFLYQPAQAQAPAAGQTPDADAINRYLRCVEPIEDALIKADEMLAITYPRFGIAWMEFKREVTANIAAGKDSSDARSHFTDRILRTAEPEALQWYQQYQTLAEQRRAACGPAPVVPTTQPPKG